MRNINYNRILLILFGLLLLSSCHKVVVIVDQIPDNTPLGEPIYISGNFNMWSPGEERYQMSLDDDSSYFFVMPAGYGQLEYKFTRGSWTSVEKSICGEEIENRSLMVDKSETVFNTIASWSDLDPIDCTRATILIEMIPSNTPNDEIIAIAGDFNSWDPDNASIATINDKREYLVTIDRPEGMNQMEYKITRGDLSSAETDEFGNELPNRILQFGKSDTTKISVQGWADLPLNQPERVTIVLKSLPKVTPKDETIYLSSKLNNWQSGDRAYRFQRNSKGELYFSFLRKKMVLDYKITRDGWNTVEVDGNGYDISNRQINLEFPDTVYIVVERWKDQEQMGDEEVTLIFNQLPETTPPNANIFIAGDFNNWNPGRLRYMLKQDELGRYYINLSRKRGSFEFKITRGSWESEAVDSEGSSLVAFKYQYRDFDTIIIDIPIENWKDIPPKHNQKSITLMLKQIPDNTPLDAKIYLAPDFNGWFPSDKDLLFQLNEEEGAFLTIPIKGKSMEYKITRGGWSRVETDASGEDIDNRVLNFGFADTVYLDVIKWKDL